MATSDDLFDQLLADGPSPSTLFHVLSQMKEDGQTKRVIQECIKALYVYPHDIRIRQLLAACYFERGLLAQAEAELEKVTKQFDVFISAYILQVEVYTRQKRMDDAAKTLSLYLAHKPEDHDAKMILESLKGVEKSPDVESCPPAEEFPNDEGFSEEVGRVENTVPGIATPTLAEVYFNQGQMGEAMNIYEKVLMQNPDDERSRQRLEELKAQMGTETSIHTEDVDRDREKKKKLLAILEAWLANIRLTPNTSPM